MRDAPGALLCRIRIKKNFFTFLPFYFFTFKEHPRWLNIPLGFFTFLPFYFFTFKDCSW